MNLESIVPPLELCKLIPEVSFADSVLVWHITNYGEIIIEPRHKKHNFLPQSYPAPTLAEIMYELKKHYWKIEHGVDGKVVCFTIDGLGSWQDHGNETITAASLRLWMKLQVIEGKK